MSAKNKRFGLLSAALLTLGLVLAACGEPGDLRDSSGTVVTAGAGKVFELRVGDCITTEDVKGSWDDDEVWVVPCSEPHDQQVFGIATHPDTAYPGASAVTRFAHAACLSLLNEPPTPTSGTVVWFLPYTQNLPLLAAKDGWDMFNDRQIVCVRYLTTP